MNEILQEIRLGFRRLALDRGSAAAMVVLLSLGVGLTTSFLSLVLVLGIQDPPHVSDPDTLIQLIRYNDHVFNMDWEYPDYDFFRDHQSSMVDLAAYSGRFSYATRLAGKAVVAPQVKWVSGNYFEVLGTRMALGQSLGISANDEWRAVVSYGFWQRQLGGSEEALGKVLEIEGVPFVIVGVVPQGFVGLGATDPSTQIWLPCSAYPAINPKDSNPLLRSSESRLTWLEVVARLDTNKGISAVQEDLNRMSAALGEENHIWNNFGSSVEVHENVRLGPGERVKMQNTLWSFFALAGLILGMTSINVALLMLTRTSSRLGELTLRQAMGGSPWQLARQFLIECGILFVVGGLGAWFMGIFGARMTSRSLPSWLYVEFQPDLWIFLSTLSVALFVVLSIGQAPILRSADEGLYRLSSRRGSDPELDRRRDAVVWIQVVLSVMTITVAAATAKSLWMAESADLGFDPDGLYSIRLEFKPSEHDSTPLKVFLKQAINELESLPGVEAVSAIDMLPFGGIMQFFAHSAGSDPESAVPFRTASAGPNFVSAMGLSLLDGRDFTFQDDESSPRVTVITATTAERLWPDVSALGRKLMVNQEAWTVVGVVADVQTGSLGEAPGLFFYRPLLQFSGPAFRILMREQPGADWQTGQVMQVLKHLEPDLEPDYPRAMFVKVSNLLVPYRITATLSLCFAFLGLVLAVTGLYGNLDHLVLQKRKAIAVRRALGAPRQRIAFEILWRCLRLTAFGLFVGLAVTWALADHLAPWLFVGQSVRDGAVALVVIVVFLVVAIVAGWLPMRKAMAVDPAEILRED